MGDTGTVAADHYHRWESDIELMNQLGLDTYRLSLSWSRILPTGSGAVNAKGLDFYDRLIDRLCSAGITAAVTLFHWDLPLALQEQGGWMNRDTSYRLGEYAQVVGERLSDRVGMWMPLNEPVVHTLYGHALGVHAPGLALGFEAFQAAHHQLLGHGLAVEALRATGCTNIGIASNHAPVRAASDSPEDVMAADIYDHVVNWMFADPVLVGKYPADEFAQLLSGPVDEDLKIIGAPLDWYGINYYEPTMIAAPVEGQGDRRCARSRPAPGACPLPLSRLPVIPQPISVGRSFPRGWARSCGRSTPASVTHCRRSTSPKADVHSTTPRMPQASSTTKHESTTTMRTFAPSDRQWTTVSTSAVICVCHFSTTSNGLRDTRSVSAWCTSISTPRSAHRRPRSRWYRALIAEHKAAQV